MTINVLSELQVALDAATIAGDYIRAEYEKFVPIPNAPANISTEIDRGSQDLILHFLAKNFPNDGLCAEEGNASKTGASANGRMWVVDPIDGTRGFAMKNGEFSVMIGLTIDGAAVAGVLLEPTTMTYTYASLGAGCWTKIGNGEPRKCAVRTESELTRSTLVQSHSRPGVLSPPAAMLAPAKVLEMYSAGVKMAVVARGEADIYVNTYNNFSDWDICAGHILVTEAGGVVSGLRGDEIRYGGAGYKQKLGLLATSTVIHPAVVSGLASMKWA